MTLRQVFSRGSGSTPALWIDDTNTDGTVALNADIVAKLATLDPSVNPCVVIGGRTANGDGAGGSFSGVLVLGGPAIDNAIVFASMNPLWRWRRIYTGPIDARWFGTSGSKAATTGTINAGSTVLTLGAAQDFQNGQGILIARAGAACTLAAPGGLVGFSTGAALVAFNYRVVAFTRGGGQSPCSATLTFMGDPVLARNYGWNNITWDTVPGARYYGVYGRANASMALLAIICDYAPGATYNWLDFGDPVAVNDEPTFIDHGTPSALAQNECLVTSISSGGGTTSLVLAAPAINAAAGSVVCHDDTAALQRAIDALATTGGDLLIPAGDYYTNVAPLVNQIDSVNVYGEGEDKTILYDNAVGQDRATGRAGTFSVNDCSAFSISRLTIQGCGSPGTHIEKQGFYYGKSIVAPRPIGENYGVRVSHITVRQTAGEAIYLDGDAEDVVWDANTVIDVFSNGMNIGCSLGRTSAVVSSNKVHGARASAFLMSCRALQLIGNYCTHRLPPSPPIFPPGPLRIGGGDVIEIAKTPNLVMTGNTIEDCSLGGSPSLLRLGFNVDAANFDVQGVVENNVIRNNQYSAGGAAIFIQNVIGPLLVRGNMLAANGKNGDVTRSIFVDGAATGAITIGQNGIHNGSNASGVVDSEGIRTTAAAGGVAFDLHVEEQAFGADMVVAQRYVFDPLALPLNPQTYRGAAAPTAARLGDVWIDPAPSTPGFIGQVCTTGGNPATWKTYGPIS